MTADSIADGAFNAPRKNRLLRNALRSAQVRRISWVLRGSAGAEAVRVASSCHRFRPATFSLSLSSPFRQFAKRKGRPMGAPVVTRRV